MITALNNMNPGSDLGLLKGGGRWQSPILLGGLGDSSILRAIFDNTFEHSAVEKGYIFGLLVLYKNFL